MEVLLTHSRKIRNTQLFSFVYQNNLCWSKGAVIKYDTGAEEIWMGYEISLRIFVGV